MRISALPALLAFLPLLLPAARLTLWDGAVIYGKFIGGTPQTVVIQDDNGVRRRLDLKEVRHIDFGGGAPRDAAGPLPGGLRDGDSEADREDPRFRSDWTVVPAGVSVCLRTWGAIAPRDASQDRTWSAVVAGDVMDSAGDIAIPLGAPATLRIRRVAAGSTLTSPVYVLDLDSVRVAGRRYMVNRAEAPAAGRTAPASALGTLLDATGGTTGGPVLTVGHEIHVPAGTLLRFRLDAPLHLREQP